MEHTYPIDGVEITEFTQTPGDTVYWTHDTYKVYHGVLQEINFLCERWQMFKQLFALDDTFSLLSHAAPRFAVFCHFAFLDATIMTIGRLNDPAETPKKIDGVKVTLKNVSMRHLIKCVEDEKKKRFYFHH